MKNIQASCPRPQGGRSHSLSVYRALYPVPKSQETKPVCISGYLAWKVMVTAMASSPHNAGRGGEKTAISKLNHGYLPF